MTSTTNNLFSKALYKPLAKEEFIAYVFSSPEVVSLLSLIRVQFDLSLYLSKVAVEKLLAGADVGAMFDELATGCLRAASLEEYVAVCTKLREQGAYSIMMRVAAAFGDIVYKPGEVPEDLDFEAIYIGPDSLEVAVRYEEPANLFPA